jgi:hypothetical protein
MDIIFFCLIKVTQTCKNPRIIVSQYYQGYNAIWIIFHDYHTVITYTRDNIKVIIIIYNL